MADDQPQPRVCGSCDGDGGSTTTTTETTADGRTVTRQTWHSCGTCRGRGTA